MPEKPKIDRYQQLIAWQAADALADLAESMVSTGSAKRDPEFCRQIRKSTGKAPAQTAEGFIRYFAPANGPDCIEIAGAYGDCGSRATILKGPTFQQHDLRFSKRTAVVGHTNLEFEMEMLNAFNHPNFLAVSGIGGTTLAPSAVSVGAW